ncbi:hypothetical protein GCM10017044_07830 [Kordiimonas sediminis]|uniref:DUF481 domain-containing protein n=1 Tax=Kordiimonas sediminis TaxID=1735581 RepID=A0A919ALU0_9PROT|nr:DUF481 domain-containing protein [Kordiimonas sediminis]GHF16003.1 hypothetical protein GCM10017044_07830 [Kordiimonas sediminis]
MPFRNSRLFALMLLSSAALPSAAVQADVPAGIEDLLKTAAANDDKATFESILLTAFVTWPDDRVTLLETAEAIRAEWMAPEEVTELKQARFDKAEAERKSRARGLAYYFDPALWNGQVELGAGQASGDSDEQYLTGGMTFNRSFGPAWEHEFDFDINYKRSSGKTTEERFIADYRLLWKPWEHLYLVNFVEFERNQPGGYDMRIVETVGLGYRVLDTDKHQLSFEAGPGVRYNNEVMDPDRGLLGLTDTEFMGRLSANYRYQINETMSFRDRTNIVFGGSSTTLENLFEYSARLNSRLAARLSFEYRYDSNPPAGTAKSDTLSRATIVYDF